MAAVRAAMGAKTTRVGWIGTGLMGQAMCGHIVDAGYSVTVFNRTRSKAAPLAERGAEVAESAAAVAARSDVLFTMLGYPADVRQVLMGDGGVLEVLKPGAVVVDMTTSEPSLARELAEAAKRRGCSSLDAPVSGGDRGARLASLAIMVGGEAEAFKRVLPLLRCMGTATLLGGAGCGQSCKLGNQVTIASTMVGMVEGMVYAHGAGLDVAQYLGAISGGAAGSKSLELYAARILARDFEAGFYVEHFVKDLGIALRECQAMKLNLPGLQLAQQLYSTLVQQGHSRLGTQSLILALEQMNNVRIS